MRRLLFSTRRWYFILIAASVPVIVVITWMLDTLYVAGEFKRLTPHFQGVCRPVYGLVGAEDITIDPTTGMAFISSFDFRAGSRGAPRQGAIYAYDLTSPTAHLIHLTQNFTAEFHPHGLSLWIGDSGERLLFVINHHPQEHSVDIFDYRAGALTYRQSIRSALMTSPNDVVAVGPNRFYVTNDHGNVSPWGRTLEEYLRLERAYVLYYDGMQFRKVASSLAMANGITVSPDGHTLYVAATVGRKIQVYTRDIPSGSLSWKDEIFLGTGVDNLERDPAGHLWVGAHPKLLTFVAHRKDPAVLSPSQVLKITPGSHGRYQSDEIYLDTGETLSGSSVGAVFGQQLLMGSVFDDHFLVCQMR
ncbi:MAG TPA: SMP-30/gluconolactonase/LRE family protein [Candidatus Competibacteraceae bacterium]|nr:SMP-30/gluconolactonase/LRE family protein [Candidatus Competibacteraceae bacterium]